MRWLLLGVCLLSACRCDTPHADMADMSEPTDMTCVYGIGTSCVTAPCCLGYQCVGGACAVVPPNAAR